MTFKNANRLLKGRQKLQEGKEKTQGKGRPSDLARIAKVSDRVNLKI